MTQRDKLLQAFKNAPDQTLSMNYIERELYLSQGNARLKELKEKGYIFEDAGKDEHGFKKHKLVTEPDTSFFDKPEEPVKEKLQFGNKRQIYELKYKKA